MCMKGLGEVELRNKMQASRMRETDNLNRILSASLIRERDSLNPNVSPSLITERDNLNPYPMPVTYISERMRDVSIYEP
jgi:hypothetical protein